MNRVGEDEVEVCVFQSHKHRYERMLRGVDGATDASKLSTHRRGIACLAHRIVTAISFLVFFTLYYKTALNF